MSIVRSALRNPHATAVLGLAILILGVTGLRRMPADLLPVFKTPVIQILTLYPGMPAEFVEKDMTSRLERWTGQANGVARQEAKSMVGVSVVKDFFRPDIDPNTAMSMVSALALSDMYYLPPGTIPPMVMPFDPTATVPLALVTVSSDTEDETQLYDVAYFEMRNRLQSVTGVIAPAVYGGKIRRILTYADRDKLQSRNLDLLDVVNGIHTENVLVPTGSAKIGDFDYQVNAHGMVDKVPKFNQLPLRFHDGKPVFVGDVATTEDSAQIQSNIVRIDGRRQVYIPIYRQPGANTIEIVNGVRNQLAAIKQRIPKDIDLDVVMDQSIYVRHSIRSLQIEGVMGALLAAAMIYLFLGSWRSTSIILISLPLAFLAAANGLFFADQTLNTMTLGGLALAVGMVVDHSIVVIENVERHLADGVAPLRAAYDGASEVAGPLFVIMSTMVVVFLPVLLLSGIGAYLFTPLGLAVAFSLAGSYLVAITIVPVLCWRLLGRSDRSAAAGGDPGLGRGRFAVWFGRLTDLYGRLLERALSFRFAVLAITAVLFAASLGLASQLGTELFPQVDAGQLSIQLRAPSGLRIEKTEALVAETEDVIREVIPKNQIVKLISNIGVLLDWPAAYTPNAGPMDAFLNIQLSDDRSRSTQAYADELRSVLAKKFTGVEFSISTGGMLTAALNFGLPSPINIQVEGKKFDISIPIAREIRDRIAEIPGAVDVRVQERTDAPQIDVEIDRVKAAELGVSNDRVVKNIVAALNSSINFSPTFWFDESNGNHYFLGVQYREDDIKSLETLKDIPISPGDGKPPVLLRNIATFKRSTTVTQVNHLNITRVANVFANVSGRDVGSVASQVERAIADIVPPPGYTIHMRGEVSSMRDSFQEMGFGLSLAVVLVYLVMVVLFRSFLDPLIIMVSMPLGLMGVVWILLATGTTLNIQSFMGAMMMVGIAVSGGILYVEFANKRLAEGATIHDAVIDAGRIRLRPIAMTSLTTILGLLPMALTPGQATTPLARAVVGGVAVSTLLTLFVVPALYTYVKRRPPAHQPELAQEPQADGLPA